MREPSLYNLPPGLRNPPRTQWFWLALLVLGAVATVGLLVGSAWGREWVGFPYDVVLGTLLLGAAGAACDAVFRRRR